MKAKTGERGVKIHSTDAVILALALRNVNLGFLVLFSFIFVLQNFIFLETRCF